MTLLTGSMLIVGLGYNISLDWIGHHGSAQLCGGFEKINRNYTIFDRNQIIPNLANFIMNWMHEICSTLIKSKENKLKISITFGWKPFDKGSD